MILTGGNCMYSERDLIQCHFSTTNLTWNGLKLHPGLRGEDRN
jgi:hypothetical protein